MGQALRASGRPIVYSHPADAGPGGWNDPDMLEVGNCGMSVDEYRTHLALWALSAAPLLLGNDLRQMTPATLALLRNRDVLAIDQDALGVFNRDAQPHRMALSADDVGTALRGRRWRDLWRGGSRPASELRNLQVAAHSLVLLRLSPSPAARAH